MKTTKDQILKYALTVFVLGLTTRVFLDLAFFLTYGLHASESPEIWLYYAVARGKFKTGLSGDPTVPLLQAIGWIVPDRLLFHAIVALSALMASLTAVLVFLLALEFADLGTAYAAGLLYAFMVGPLSLSVAAFTHDHLAIPVNVLIVLLFLKAVKSKTHLTRIPLLAAAAILLYFGGSINSSVYVSAAVVAAFVASWFLRGFPRYFPHFTAFFFVGFLVFGFCFLPEYMDYVLGQLPQGRLGSSDVVPASPANLWLKYNVLLSLLPFGFFLAYRRRDYASISYALLGFVFASVMDRGTRLSDVGVAMLAAYALVGWKQEWTTPFRLLLAASLAYSVIIIPFPLVYHAHVFVAAMAAGLLMAYRGRASVVLFVICVLGVSLVSATMFFNTSKVVSEAEYRLLKDVVSKLDRERVLVSWDRGFMVEALTDKKAVSSAGWMDYGAHEAFWLPEKQAHQLLNRLGVDYIVFSDEYYNQIVYAGELHYLLAKGMVFTPNDLPPIAIADRITAYKLRYGTNDPAYFKKIQETDDPLLQRHYTIYEVAKSKTNSTLITVLALNDENHTVSASVSLTLYEYAGGKKPKTEFGQIKSEVMKPENYLKCAATWLLRLTSLGVVSYLLIDQFNNRKKRGKRWQIYLIAGVVVVSAAMAYSLAPEGCCKQETPEVQTTITHHIQTAEFPPGNMSELAFDIGKTGDLYNCTAEIAGGGPSGFVGSVTFYNVCGQINENASILLVDSTATEKTGNLTVEDYREVNLRLKNGEKKKVDYAFKRQYPNHDYEVGFYKTGCVAALANESTPPTLRGVEIYHVFCGRATDLRDQARIS